MLTILEKSISRFFLFVLAIISFYIMMISTVCILFTVLFVASFDPTSFFVEAKLGLRGRFRHHSQDAKSDELQDAHSTTTEFQQNVHVLLLGLPERTCLTPGQAHFFDESLRAAYNSFNTIPDLQVVQVEIVDQQEGHPESVGGNRELSGWNPRYGRFYDYSVFMTARCGRMCLNYRRRRQLPTNTPRDIDDKGNNIQKRRRREQQEHPSPMLTLPDVDHTKFERAFLSMLQRGPHLIFHQVEDCQIAWN